MVAEPMAELARHGERIADLKARVENLEGWQETQNGTLQRLDEKFDRKFDRLLWGLLTIALTQLANIIVTLTLRR